MFQTKLFLLVGQIAQETKMTFSTHPPDGMLLGLPPLVLEVHTEIQPCPWWVHPVLAHRFVCFREKMHFEDKRLKTWRCLENLGQEASIWTTPL